jgi:hypothetical protein
MNPRSSKAIAIDSIENSAEWDEVVRLTFEACMHRSEGREVIARKILQGRLPAAIGSWSRTCGLPVSRSRESLKAMFGRMREQVAMASVQRRMILGDLGLRRPSARPSDGRIGLRQRIPIGNIADMLDAIAEVASCRTTENFEGPVMALSA